MSKFGVLARTLKVGLQQLKTRFWGTNGTGN